MSLIADLTIAEVAAEVADPLVQSWWEDAANLPAGADTAEFFAKTLQAAFIAQSKKNAAGTPAVGEALNAYLTPQATAPVTNTTTGEQSYTITHSVQVLASVDLNVVIPQRA
ncbi:MULTISPECIES: hypothetical protein [unclassified Nodularia (in: cyanobacteria)]|uniref:hypothetical protein n=1 Tax=unclassified Nodularia (in: cyanobacteria) TaxID=2656917 RepID=UPI001882D1D2|nr:MULTISPECIES: hypothetical protein [unclassified Nodularia (in: cyanobacteria)]MBE9199085.1 hypothetical protein [Nodularia sp. LEGE 06071]MCC2695772.1 hypothetical protein [Nodularia sp. LEGE 04288]